MYLWRNLYNELFDRRRRVRRRWGTGQRLEGWATHCRGYVLSCVLVRTGSRHVTGLQQRPHLCAPTMIHYRCMKAR